MVTMNKVFFVWGICLLVFVAGYAEISNVASVNLPVTDGPVFALAQTSDTVYMGGKFSYVGPWTGGGVPCASTAWTPGGDGIFASYAKVNGYVNVSVPDGAGGWYIGGTFDLVGDLPCNNLAHILADGTVDTSWAPSANASVSALALDAGTLYVGGLFTSINGATRKYVAALNAATAALLPWDPNANSYVAALAVLEISPSTKVVVAGGGFTNIGGSARQYLASIDSSTGTAVPWNPSPNGPVTILAKFSNSFIVGGYFSQILGQPRQYLARFLLDGSLTAGAPNPDGAVKAILPAGAVVYIGGTFQNILGQSRNGLAKLSADLTTLSLWNPDTGGPAYIDSLAKVGDTILVGGTFVPTGSPQRRQVLAISSIPIGVVASVAVLFNGGVTNITPSGDSVFLGGGFSSCGGTSCSNLVAFDSTTGALSSFFPIPNEAVKALAISDNSLYVGGMFTNIAGTPVKISRQYIAKINTDTGQLEQDFVANPSMFVHTLAVGKDALYVGGAFTTIGGQARNYIAALNFDTGQATDWNPNANGDVFSLLAVDDAVYAGGAFTTIGGESRTGMVALNAQTGAILPVSFPNINGAVFALGYRDNTLYVGGAFTGLPGGRRSLVAFDTTTGNLTPMICDVAGEVHAVVPYGDRVYLAGNFSMVNGEIRDYLASVMASSGVLTSWAPAAAFVSDVHTLSARKGVLTVGGEFLHIGGRSVYHLASFPGMNPDEGTLTIDVTPNTGQWQISGPPGFEGNGATYTGDKTFSNAPAGLYTVQPKPLAGYTSPVPQQIALTAGSSANLTLTWRQSGTVVVDVTPDNASWTLSGPSGFAGNGATYTGDRTFNDVPVGSYTWTGNALAGYTTPSSQTQTLTAGGTVTFTKVWTATGGGGGGGGGTTPGGCTKGLVAGVEGGRPSHAGLPGGAEVVMFAASGAALTAVGRLRGRRGKDDTR